MGWIGALWRILRDKVKAGYLDLIFELTWTALSIFTVLVLWNSVVSKVPTGWSTDMVLSFAIFLELYYIVRSYIRDMAWLYHDYFLDGIFEPFLKPHPYLYGILRRNDGGYILATLIKAPLLLLAVVLLSPKWWLGLIAFVLGLLFYTGFELFVVGISLLFLESGRLWNLFYSFLGYLVEIPADFYRGAVRLFVTVFLPVYFSATFPAKAVFGVVDDFPLLLLLSVLWLALGWGVVKRATITVQAYGG